MRTFFDQGADAHAEWLGYVQPVGVVVSSAALLEAGVLLNRDCVPLHRRFLAAREVDADPLALFTDVLGWRREDLAAPEPSLTIPVPGYDDLLCPEYTVQFTETKLLISRTDELDLDADRPAERHCWNVSPQLRFERLDASLLNEGVPNETVETMLRTAMARDIEELLPHLQKRADDYADDAVAKLTQRSEEEAKQMRGILEAQRKHIHATTAKHAQTALPFEGEERRQFEANQSRWLKRLAEIETELDMEPERVRDVYRVFARRVEPVGLVYLWPSASGGR